MVVIPKLTLENTLVDVPRLKKIMEFLDETKGLYGDNAEVGVYKGGTAYLIVSHSGGKRLHLFDTFKGMPKTKPIDLHHEGDFSDTSVEAVKNLVGIIGIYYYKGIFPKETGRYIEGETFSFVHLDCDIYDSVKDSLEFFWPRLTPGGIIALDDYNEPNCPGAKLATDEFMMEHNLKIYSECQSQIAIKKDGR